MSVKKEKNVIDLSRLQALMNSKDSRTAIAKDLGCDVSTITKHFNGDRAVTTEYLSKYAKYFNVSADYLLGISNVPSIDVDVQRVCGYTGLGSNTAYLLHSAKSCAPNLIEFLSFWVSNLEDCGMADILDKSSKAYEDYIKKAELILENLKSDYIKFTKEQAEISECNQDDYFQIYFDIQEGIKKLKELQNYFEFIIYKASVEFVEELKVFLFKDESMTKINELREELENYLSDINSILLRF